MYLVASVRPSACLSDLSWLNSLTYDLDFWYSALPSATKSKEESLSARGVCLCVE